MANVTEYDPSDPEGSWVRNFNRVQNSIRQGESPEQIFTALTTVGWPESEARRLLNAQGERPSAPAATSDHSVRKSHGGRRSRSRSDSSEGKRRRRRGLPADSSWGCVQTIGILWIILGGALVYTHFDMKGKTNSAAWGDWEGMRILLGVIGVAYLIVAIGLLLRQRWSRMPAILLGGIMCMHFPFGTIAGVIFLAAISKNERTFRRRH